MTKRLFKIFFLTCLIATLFSCATRQKYIDQQKAWIGKNVETYVYVKKAINAGSMQQAGNPMNSLIMANRNPQFVQFGALMCTTWVSVNKDTKIIKNITFRGNYCATSN